MINDFKFIDSYIVFFQHLQNEQRSSQDETVNDKQDGGWSVNDN